MRIVSMKPTLLLVCALVEATAANRSIAQAPAPERTRTFPDQCIKFTLPSDDWSWEEANVSKGLCFAVNKIGWTFTMTYMPLPKGMELDHNAAMGFEKSLYDPGELDKRGGGFLTFKGLRCYQTQGVLANGRTTATRIIHAHGYGLYLTVIGGKEPIELQPEFESIMDHVNFLTPPQAIASSGQGDSGQAIHWVVPVAAGCVVIGLLFVLVRWFRQGSQA